MNEEIKCCTTCALCETRRQSERLGRYVNPLEVYYGMGTPAAEYVRANPGLPIWIYDDVKRKAEENAPNKDQPK